MQLLNLDVGSHFRLRGMPEVAGILVLVNECRARVRIDGTAKLKEFETIDGEVISFRSKATEADWSPLTEVERA